MPETAEQRRSERSRPQAAAAAQSATTAEAAGLAAADQELPARFRRKEAMGITAAAEQAEKPGGTAAHMVEVAVRKILPALEELSEVMGDHIQTMVRQEQTQ